MEDGETNERVRQHLQRKFAQGEYSSEYADSSPSDERRRGTWEPADMSA
jgi:hypothetical protein